MRGLVHTLYHKACPRQLWFNESPLYSVSLSSCLRWCWAVKFLSFACMSVVSQGPTASLSYDTCHQQRSTVCQSTGLRQHVRVGDEQQRQRQWQSSTTTQASATAYNTIQFYNTVQFNFNLIMPLLQSSLVMESLFVYRYACMYFSRLSTF